MGLQSLVMITNVMLLATAIIFSFDFVECKGRGGGGGHGRGGGGHGGNAGLEVGFYDHSCPDMEKIVFQEMQKAVLDSMTPGAENVAPDMLRLFFHDCFVHGCDGSILLDGPNSEKTAPPNFGLGAFDVVEAAKTALEKACPSVVSCADILAFAARDSVVLSGGQYWRVPAGLRDGKVSLASEAVKFLPGATMTVQQLIANFARKGLSPEQLADLSGAHTIGDSRCVQINNRLYNYPSPSHVDPKFPRGFADTLKKKCPSPDTTNKVDLDLVTPLQFDTKYYTNLVNKTAILSSDMALLDDKKTYTIVLKNRDRKTFFARFANAMVALGQVEVLTGSNGEIRQHCFQVNSM